MTTAVQLAQSVAPGVSLGFKNRIINGGMTIDQRNAGASVTITTGNEFSVDRFQGVASVSSKFSLQQSTTTPAGFVNSLKATSLSAYSVGASEQFLIKQNIEGLNVSDLGWGSASASAVTLSFKVYSSLTGTFGGALFNNDGSRSYPFTYTVSSANTWTNVSVTIAGDTSGTWLTTNGVGITVSFGLGVGSTYSGTAGSWAGAYYASATGATSVVGTNGATFYITGVQLEVGTAATSFEFRDYGRELIMCQRYYWNANLSGGQYWFASPIDLSGAYRRYSVVYPTTMRATPTITLTALTNGSFSGSYPQPESYGDTSAVCGCDVTASNYFAWVTSFKASAEL